MTPGLSSEITCNPMYCVGGLLWTQSEKQRLFNAYKKMPLEKLTRLFPDRSIDSLKTKASRLKIPRPGRHWTQEEEQLLVTLRGQGLPYKRISKHFKARSPAACRNRMSVLRRRGI